MCAVSAVGDFYMRQWPQKWPGLDPFDPNKPIVAQVSRYEFDRLVQEVKQLKELLLRAKAFDEATGQPGCEMDEKVKLIRAVADQLGVDLSKIFPAQGLAAQTAQGSTGSAPVVSGSTAPSQP